uniref:REC8 meiotic recombination protein n=1 Tax=Catagonus wagneri TaxID=51154 RepID=A0A8C3WT03_9CETA
MFYYPNVLQRHTGCFATIWLAATRGTRLVKREYLKVNVVKTCEEIINYVLVRVQPPLPGLPRPRFSLYLSAQLQIGVIRVYFQQCQYLVDDIQHILERLHRAQLQIRIDMVETDLPSLLIPSHLAMMETLEDAPDPFFGMMSEVPRLPSPFDIPQLRHLLEAVTPEKVLEEILPEVPVEPRKPELIPVTVRPPEAITLLEAEPIRMLPVEGELELPEISRRDLDLLIAEEDEAILLEERRLERPLPLEGQVPGSGGLGLGGVPRWGLSSFSCPCPPRVERPAEPLPVQVLAPEELKPAVWEPGVLLPGEYPPLVPLLPSLQRRPPVSPPPRRRRRRQLLFWDKETQISRERFQAQLQTRAHCWECVSAALFRTLGVPYTSHPSLLPLPSAGRLPRELLDFWTRCAQPLPRALRERPPPELEEEAARKAAAEEERRKCTALAPSLIRWPQRPSCSAANTPARDLSLPSEISLEAAEEEKTRISLAPPEERWAWAEAEQPEAPALPVVPEVPEVPVEMPTELPPEPELLSLEAVHRAVALELQANREPDFSSLVPPLSPRRMAARVFYLLLVLAAQQILCVRQEKPYGRLVIQPGPRFHFP